MAVLADFAVCTVSCVASRRVHSVAVNNMIDIVNVNSLDNVSNSVDTTKHHAVRTKTCTLFSTSITGSKCIDILNLTYEYCLIIIIHLSTESSAYKTTDCPFGYSRMLITY